MIMNIIIILLFIIILFLLVALTNVRREYKSVNTTGYYYSLFIINKGIEGEWKEYYMKKTKQEEEQNAKEKN